MTFKLAPPTMKPSGDDEVFNIEPHLFMHHALINAVVLLDVGKVSEARALMVSSINVSDKMRQLTTKDQLRSAVKKGAEGILKKVVSNSEKMSKSEEAEPGESAPGPVNG